MHFRLEKCLEGYNFYYNLFKNLGFSSYFIRTNVMDRRVEFTF
jgi:hypothetical protein